MKMDKDLKFDLVLAGAAAVLCVLFANFSLLGSVATFLWAFGWYRLWAMAKENNFKLVYLIFSALVIGGVVFFDQIGLLRQLQPYLLRQ